MTAARATLTAISDSAARRDAGGGSWRRLSPGSRCAVCTSANHEDSFARECTGKSYCDFLKARIARIYPLHLIMMTVSLAAVALERAAICLAGGNFGPVPLTGEPSVAGLLVNLVMLQGAVGARFELGQPDLVGAVIAGMHIRKAPAKMKKSGDPAQWGKRRQMFDPSGGATCRPSALRRGFGIGHRLATFSGSSHKVSSVGSTAEWEAGFQCGNRSRDAACAANPAFAAFTQRTGYSAGVR